MKPVVTPVRSKPLGDAAVLLECRDTAHALALYGVLAAAREQGELRAEDLVPAERSVVVLGGDARNLQRLLERLPELLLRHEHSAHSQTATETVEIPVVYDGADLREVAALTGLSVAEVISRHTQQQYCVAFTGFSPGFAYLTGGDERLIVPRRATPRTRMPAGAVALAGAFSGVYPRASPGGWQIIGSTDKELWNIERAVPALLAPGMSVRFVQLRERIALAQDAGTARSETPISAVEEVGEPVLRIIEAGFQSLVQDRGRLGQSAMGVSPSGAADRGSLRAANRLVGNDDYSPALEIGPGKFVAEATRVIVIAVTGAERAATLVDQQGMRIAIAANTALRIDPGQRLELRSPTQGLRSYLAIRDGICAQQTLGSVARDTLGELGPAPLASGDFVSKNLTRITRSVGLPSSAGTRLPEFNEVTELRVIAGPHIEWLAADSTELFWQQEWKVSVNSNRVGARLEGKPLARNVEFLDRELPTAPLCRGAIQLPPNGEPLVFLSDHPLTGGYPIAAVILEEDCDLAGQLAPGDRIRFKNVDGPSKTSVEAAAESAACTSMHRNGEAR